MAASGPGQLRWLTRYVIPFIAGTLICAAFIGVNTSRALAQTWAPDCYWGDSACDYGYMAAFSPTAWTPTLTLANRSVMDVDINDSYTTMTVQIRPYTGASGYSWSYTGWYLSQPYTAQNAQGRCFDSGGGHRWTYCEIWAVAV